MRAQQRRALPRTRAVERVRNRIAGMFGYAETDEEEESESTDDESSDHVNVSNYYK